MRTPFVLAVALTVTLAGCSGGSGADDPATTGTSLATTTSTRAPTTTTTAPSTTTTLGPDEIVEAFVSNFADPGFQAEAEVEITVEVDGVEYPGTGTMRFSGEDFHGVTELDPAARTEQITVGGLEFERSGDGPWTLEDGGRDAFDVPEAGPGGPDLEIVAWLRTLEALEHSGTEQDGDLTMHRLVVPEDEPIDPVAFGFSPDDDVVIEAEFGVRADGFPHRMSFRIVDVTVLERPIRMQMDLVFAERGPVYPILAPGDYLVRRHSDDLGYSIAVPETWDRIDERSEEYSYDYFLGLDAEELHVYPGTVLEPGQIPLNALLNDYRASLDGEATRVIDSRETTVGSYPARMLRYEETIEGYEWQVFYVVSQQAADRFFEFVFWDLPGDLDGSTGFLEMILGTFEPLEG